MTLALTNSRMKTIHLNLFSKPVVVEICLLTEINCENIKTIIPSLNCSLINPKLIISYDQLTTAITKTVSNHLSGTMKTRSPYTELLFCLSPSTNVTESLKAFGAEERATEAIAVRFTFVGSFVSDSFASDLEKSLNCSVEEFSTRFCNLSLVKLVYKPTSHNDTKLIGEICTTLASKNI